MTEKLMNQSQGADIIEQLDAIADNLAGIKAISPAKFGMGYAVCDTAASTAAKTANIANYTLTEGALVTVKFTNANTASNATLNISNTGAKPLLYKGSAITGEIIGACDICTFIYSTANSGSYSIINIDALSGAGAGTVKSVGAEGGIITDQTSGAAISTTGSVKLNLKSNTAFSSVAPDPVTTEGRIYPVALDSAGHPAVDVPWTDTTYTQAANSAITVNNTNHTIDVAAGTTSTAGVVQLADSYTSTATDKAATPNAVKAAYDLASSKYAKPSGGIPKTDLASGVQTSLTAADNAVPKTRKINNTALTDDITLTAASVGAVPTSRTVNTKALSDNITLSGDDIKLTSYTKGTAKTAVAATDKVNEAIAKHENRLDQQNSDLAELQSEVTGLNSSLVEIVNNGVKNIINITSVSKTSTTAVGFGKEKSFDPIIPAGTYMVSYDITRSDTTKNGQIGFRDVDGTYTASPNYWPLSDGRYAEELTFTKAVKSMNFWYNGTGTATISNIMVCDKTLYELDAAYEPYALGNQILTPAMIEQVDSGAKNLLNCNKLTSAVESKGITFTPLSDGTIKATGTNDGTGNSAALLRIVAVHEFDGLIISGLPVTDSYAHFRVQRNATPWDGDDYAHDAQIGSYSYETLVYVVINQGTALPSGGVIFKPMLCTKADWDVSQKFVPYRPNWDLVGKLAVPIIIEKQVSIANSLIDTGVTYTLPANNYYRITAYQKYNNNAPATIAIVNNQNADPLLDTGVYAITETPYPENSYMRALSTSTIVKTGSTAETLYVFAKARGSTAKNNIIALVIEPLN